MEAYNSKMLLFILTQKYIYLVWFGLVIYLRTYLFIFNM